MPSVTVPRFHSLVVQHLLNPFSPLAWNVPRLQQPEPQTLLPSNSVGKDPNLEHPLFQMPHHFHQFGSLSRLRPIELCAPLSGQSQGESLEGSFLRLGRNCGGSGTRLSPAGNHFHRFPSSVGIGAFVLGAVPPGAVPYRGALRVAIFRRHDANLNQISRDSTNRYLNTFHSFHSFHSFPVRHLFT
jgi:hypothetical protein